MRGVPFFFETSGQPLMGWYHPPAATPRDTCVVICPPLGYEYLASYRTLRLAAERLADRGFGTLRFDYPGTGDSAGDEHEPGLVRAWVEAVGIAADTLRQRSLASRVVVIGLRLGATIGTHAASARDDVGGLVLWAPCLTGAGYVRELRALQAAGSEAAEPGALEAGGFAYPDSLVEGIRELDLLALSRRPAPQVLLAARADLPAPRRLEARLVELGAAITVEPVSGMGDLLDVSTPRVILPEAALRTVLDWVDHAFPDRAGTAAPEPLPWSEVPVVVPGEAKSVVECPLRLHPEDLFGILSEPGEGPTETTALLLLNTGREHRIGTSRMWVRLARRWAAGGFRVLRLDLSGLGDSPAREGAPEDRAYAPSAPADVRRAVRALIERGATRVAVLGLCSGAYWAIHAGADRLPLAGICAVNPQLYWRPGDPEMGMHAGPLAAAHQMKRLGRSARSPRKWARLLSGRTGAPAVVRTVILRFRMRPAYRQLRSRARLAIAELTRVAELPGPSLVVFATDDPGLTFLEAHEGGSFRSLQRGSGLRIETISGADHSFTAAGPRHRLEGLLEAHVRAGWTSGGLTR